MASKDQLPLVLIIIGFGLLFSSLILYLITSDDSIWFYLLFVIGLIVLISGFVYWVYHDEIHKPKQVEVAS